MRPGAFFIAFCMLVIAGSTGAMAYLYLEIGAVEAATVALATLTALALYHALFNRVGLRSVVNRQLADLSRGGADVARQVAEMGRRLAAVEGKIESALDDTRALTDPFTVEIGEIGAELKRLAGAVAAQQAMLDRLRGPADRPAQTSSAPPVAGGEIERQRETRSEKPDATAGTDVRAAILEAIDANRIDLYLQPIVTLPQRKVRYYEARSRLRNAAGGVLHASEFVPAAESSGLMARIDRLAAFRCVQLLRRLLMKNREIGLFCNLSRATLTDTEIFPQFLDFMTANRAIASFLVFQLPQDAVQAMDEREHAAMAALAERGFRFSMDQVKQLRLDAGELAPRGFRYIKVHAELLLKEARAAPAKVDSAELSDLLGRFGVDLIADRIDDENKVIDLLDRDVHYGQGVLFSPARPVRAEALQGAPELAGARANAREGSPDQTMPLAALTRGGDPMPTIADGAGQGAVTRLARDRAGA